MGIRGAYVARPGALLGFLQPFMECLAPGLVEPGAVDDQRDDAVGLLA